MLDKIFNFNKMPLIGHITRINYNEATILSHDWHVASAKFVPKGCFLLLHVEPSSDAKNSGEKSIVLLLRVNNISYVDQNDKLNKQQTVQNIVNPENNIIDYQKKLNDPVNQNKLSFYELNCKILGSFYESNNDIYYGSDAYSFAVAYIYKVYKPMGKELEYIVNFIKEDRLNATNKLLSSIAKKDVIIQPFEIGIVRYSSTRISDEDKKDQTKVKINPSDFIKQKTGVFGMTRTGKSNTVKIIAKSIMNLSKNVGIPMGQLIYDINGEYANDNEQNSQLTSENLYSVDITSLNNQNKKFLPALNNFYLSPDYGLKIIQKGIMSQEKGSNYINVFLSIKSVSENPIMFLLWISLLFKCEYGFPKILDNQTFSQGVLEIKQKDGSKIEEEMLTFDVYAGLILFNTIKQEFLINVDQQTLNMLQQIDVLRFFKISVLEDGTAIRVDENSLREFNKKFLKQQFKQDGDGWKVTEHPLYKGVRDLMLDNELHYFSLLGFILQEDRTSGSRFSISGWQLVVPYQYSHCRLSHNDYREQIYEKLKIGETIIIDLSIGDPFTRKYISDELMEYIFNKQVDIFRTGENCPIVNVFIEEAHNVLGKDSNVIDLWPRVAKEGAKYNIGVIYATQEPSAIHESMLANTANFIVAHLNNEKELKIISSYEDMGDFYESIKRAEDVGFVRLRLLSKPYTIPVQINKFE